MLSSLPVESSRRIRSEPIALSGGVEAPEVDGGGPAGIAGVADSGPYLCRTIQAAFSPEKENRLTFSNSIFFSVARFTTATLFCSGFRSFLSRLPSLKVGEMVKANHFESSEKAISGATVPPKKPGPQNP